MGTADDGEVVPGHHPVAVHVAELEPAGRFPILVLRGGIARGGPGGRVELRDFRGAREVAVRLVPIERPDRIADLVDDMVREARGIGTEERQRPLVVEADDLVLVMSAVEGRAPRRLLAQRSPVANGEIDAGVLYRSDVDDRWSALRVPCRAR